jgi:hypothetical protein
MPHVGGAGGGGRARPSSQPKARRGASWAAEPAGPCVGGRGAGRAWGKPAGPRALMGHKERGKYFPFSIFLFGSKLHSKILFTNHSTTSKKIMVRYDATTKQNISRVY